MGDLPLAEAERRLRMNPPPGFPGRRGRPRKHAQPAVTAPPAKGSGEPRNGYGVVTRPVGTRENRGRNDGAGVYETPAPRRLLDLAATAAYLGLAPWTVRELEWRAVLRRVRIPLPSGGELRKLLFDRADLDRLIERWKDAAP